MKLSTFDAFKTLQAPPGAIVLEGETLKRYQQALLKIADDIVEVCEKENITWHLTGGSALGAVRHHGIIPWDDDMDFDILGKDFDRFVKAFLAEHGDSYWVNTCETPGYGILTYSVRLKNSVFRSKDDFGRDDAGFRIDINRIENTFDNALLRYIHGTLCMGMGFLLSCRNFYEKREGLLSLVKEDENLRRIFLIKVILGAPLSFLSLTRWAVLTQKCYALCKNDHSVFVSVPAGRKHFFGELYRRSDFVESAEMDFEGRRWKIPKDYDGYLRHMYGDYQRIPSENERETHVLLELRFPDEQETKSCQHTRE